MDLLFVFHLIVLPVEVFCVGAVHGDGEAAAGFVFTLTTSDQAEGHCLWCTRWLVPGLGTRELVTAPLASCSHAEHYLPRIINRL